MVIVYKDSEETVILQNSEEIFGGKEQELCQEIPLVDSDNIQRDYELPRIMTEQEIIMMSSDSEKEVGAEQKSDKELWKFRNPKRSRKYNPDEMEDT